MAGVVAIASGLTAVQGMALSMLSFSGIAQLIVCQLLAANSPVPVAIVAGSVVSLRFAMYSAAILPPVAHLDWRKRALISFLMVDQSFAMTTRHFSAPGDPTHREWHTLGACSTIYVSWQLAVGVGIAVALTIGGLGHRVLGMAHGCQWAGKRPEAANIPKQKFSSV